MSDFKQIVEYLKIFRRSSQSDKNEKYIEGIVLDENYQDDYEEDTKVVVEKETINESIHFTPLRNIMMGSSSLYMKINTQEPFYDYFIQRENVESTTGELVYEYRNIFGDSWVNISESLLELPIVSSSENYFYSHDYKKVVLLPLQSFFGYPDWLIYHPNAISQISNEEYVFNYKDHEGYTNEALDFSLRFLLEPAVAFINNLRKRLVDVEKSTLPGKMYLYPHIAIEMNKYVLYYNYVTNEKTFFKTAQNPYAIRLEFNYLGAMLEFLNQTVFYESESLSFSEGSPSKKYFYERYKNLVNTEINIALQKNIVAVLEILYYTPKLFLKEINNTMLWDILKKTIQDRSLTNIGLNEEDIVLVLLEVLSEVEKTPNIFFLKLLEEKQKKESCFILLYEKMNGENFVKLVQFLYNLWLKSSFIYFDNPYFVYDEGSFIIPYKSEKFAGFYSSNRNFDFKKGIHIEVSEDESWVDNIISVFDPNLGEYVNQIVEEQNKFTYHVLQPLLLADIQQESPIPLPRLIPAFFLKANEDKAYWSNVMTSIEYTIDIVTTFSGIGNLAKFRHLARVAKIASKYKLFDRAKKISYLSKIRFGVSAIEISSGSLNVLLKLSGEADTRFGKALTEYLFWLELLSLGGELTAAIKGGLRKSAQDILIHTDDLERKLDNLVVVEDNIGRKLTNDEIDDFFKHLDEVAGFKKAINQYRKIVYSKGLRGEANLTLKQKDEILEYAKKYNIDEKNIDFKDGISDHETGYSLMFGLDRLVINTDVMPGKFNTANSRLSWRAAIAHELEGHRLAALNNKTFFDSNLSGSQNNLLEEMQASIRASKHGKDLNKVDRLDLLDDALERFKSHKDILKGSKYENYNFEQITQLLWITKN